MLDLDELFYFVRIFRCTICDFLFCVLHLINKDCCMHFNIFQFLWFPFLQPFVSHLLGFYLSFTAPYFNMLFMFRKMEKSAFLHIKSVLVNFVKYSKSHCHCIANTAVVWLVWNSECCYCWLYSLLAIHISNILQFCKTALVFYCCIKNCQQLGVADSF
jgi:hypothetical protein